MLKIYTFYYYLIAHKTLDKLVPESEGTRLELILFPVHSLSHTHALHTYDEAEAMQTDRSKEEKERKSADDDVVVRSNDEEQTTTAEAEFE